MSQNFCTSSSSWRFLLGFALATGLLLTLIMGLALYLGPPDGDLTRIGRMASIDLAPRQEQAPLQRLSNPPPGRPDLLVLGDSFSAENLWQSELHRISGLNIQSWQYLDIGCPDEWLKAAILDQSADSSSAILVETIERELIPRFSDPQRSCGSSVSKPRAVAAGTIGKNSSSLFPIDLSYVLQAAHHHFRHTDDKGRKQSRMAVTVDLTTDSLFSNRLPSRLTYFSGDDEKWRDWSADQLQMTLNYLSTMRAFAAQHGKQLWFVVIPDKNTTYASWIAAGQLPDPPSPALFPALTNILGADSNYLPAFREAAGNIVDFYRPDDSHLSLDGYRFLAAEIQQRLNTPIIPTLSPPLRQTVPTSLHTTYHPDIDIDKAHITSPAAGF